MIQERLPLEAPAQRATAEQPAWTWRYAGPRDEADLAYCRRFGVNQAPEPLQAFGAWCYALPERTT